ncbi:MAG: hypothetical protein HXX11_16770 [Desulfuromonadales bacterium]|nr:hypothetical protein [Desulfuromonadales bacterium]
MRRLLVLVAGLSITLLLSSLPLIAEEKEMGKMLEPGQGGQKDECLLVARNCAGEVDSIQQRIDRLQREISRGTDVYTNDELRSLRNELNYENKLLDYMINEQ